MKTPYLEAELVELYRKSIEKTVSEFQKQAAERVAWLSSAPRTLEDIATVFGLLEGLTHLAETEFRLEWVRLFMSEKVRLEEIVYEQGVRLKEWDEIQKRVAREVLEDAQKRGVT